MAEGYTSFSILILIIIAFGGILFVYIFKGRRAIRKVIEIFYRHNALRINDAKTLEEIGLKKPGFAQRIMRGRDYKQYALQILIKRGVINVTEDGRLYMDEDKLDQNLRCKRNADGRTARINTWRHLITDPTVDQTNLL